MADKPISMISALTELSYNTAAKYITMQQVRNISWEETCAIDDAKTKRFQLFNLKWNEVLVM